MKACGIVFAVSSVFLLFEGEFGGMLFFLLLSALCFFLWYRKKQQLSPGYAAKFADWPETCNGEAIAYRYEEVLLYTPPEKLKERLHIKSGAELKIIREPSNEYDCNAVKFLHNGKLVGYIYRNNLQDMLNDWLVTGHPVKARFINYPSKENARINLVFYRNKKKAAK